jgi:hypothetical protein
MRILPIAMVGLMTGCKYEENLPEQDLKGKIRIPKEAISSLTLIDDDGVPFVENGEAILRDEDGDETDRIDITGEVGLLGPVYIGAYPSVEDGHYDYKHPEMGPILDANFPGDTYPYGGTTVGRFDYGCYEQLVCKVVTGRFTSYSEIIDFFRDVVQEPILGQDGTEVTSGVAYQEQCFEGQNLTDEHELAFVDEEPFETDESLGDYFKPYFQDKGEFFEAEVIIPHALVEKGMSIWGWVDMPSKKFSFSSCDEGAGKNFYRYSEQFYTGTNYPNVLNFPGLYIDDGDWVVDDEAIVTNAEQEFVIEMSYKFEG